MSTSASVISAETTIIEPLPEPAATLDTLERTLAGTAGLLSALLKSPLMTPEMRRAWGSQMEMRRDELQQGVIRIAHLSQEARS
jgi:hypothetical protein